MSPSPRSPLVDPSRRRSLPMLFRAAAGWAALSVLQGCGGGDATPVPPPPVPAPVPAPAPAAPVAAQASVPEPVGYDAERLAAFDRLNEIRLSAGLGLLAQNVLLDRAAQAHADWIIANDSFTHEEVAGTSGFTGAHWWDRDEALGYVPVGGEELMAGIVHGAQGVDVLVNGVYHRAGMLAFEPVDVGIGWSGLTAASISMPLVVDMTCPGDDLVRSLGQAAQPAIDGVAIWPLDGARDVPLRLGLESPNPVPGQDVSTLGTPVSVTVDNEATIDTASFVLTNSATGEVVTTRILTQRSDPNLLVPRSFVALVPLSPLTPGARYQAVFRGTSTEFGAGSHRSIDRAWTFTAAPQ
jgi:hypothetical protein